MFGIGKAKEPPAELNETVTALLGRIANVEQRILALELEAETFRNKVLRKIQRSVEDDVQAPQNIRTLRAGAKYTR